MNLYVSGCSFTYGHETKDNEHTIKSHRPLWTWSDHLAKHFEGQFVNEAWPGGSNRRLLRRAMTFFNSVTTRDWTAVIQFTDPFSRFEYFDSKHNIFVSMFNDQYLLDDQYYNNMQVPFGVLTDESAKMFMHRNLLLSEKEIAIEYFQQIISMDQYLKQRSIPHLFTFMSGASCHPDVIIDNLVSTDVNQKPKHSLDAQLLELYNCLPRGLFMKPMSYMIEDVDRENPPEDKHPNKTGHYKIYLYILNELQKRNYL